MYLERLPTDPLFAIIMTVTLIPVAKRGQSSRSGLITRGQPSTRSKGKFSRSTPRIGLSFHQSSGSGSWATQTVSHHPRFIATRSQTPCPITIPLSPHPSNGTRQYSLLYPPGGRAHLRDSTTEPTKPTGP
jgi:hypothetical protein